MTDLKLDTATHDLVIEGGDLQFLNTLEDEARQSVVITLNTYRGEWFMDINYGVPYLENDNNPVQLFGSKDKVVFDSYVKEAILYQDQVLSIIDYSSELDSNKGLLTITAEVETPVGPITITTNTV